MSENEERRPVAISTRIEPEKIEAQLTQWLSSQEGEGEVRASNIEMPKSSGMSTETVMFDITRGDGDEVQRCVARVAPTGEGLFPSYDLECEAEVIDALAERTDAPLPGILFREDDPSVIGAPFFVMERVDGEVPGDDPPFTTEGWVMELSDEQRARLSDNGLQVLAKIHDADVEALGLGHLDPGGDGDVLDRHIAYWEDFHEWAAAGAEHPTIAPALEWLKANRPDDLGPIALSWGDARIGNMLFAEDQSVAAVLDWEMVGLAPREADLAWWMFIVRHHTEGIGAPLPSGFPTPEETVARYQELTGHEVRNLEYFEVFAGVRLAILVQRAAHLLIEAGHIPDDSLMGLVNPATNLLAQTIELPAPEGQADYYIGNR